MKHCMKWLAAALFTLVYSSAQANICVELNLPSTDSYTFNDVIDIPTVDGITLDANLFTPTQEPGPNGYPTIIFINSWVLEEHEYIVQAKQFVKKGYQVLSYSARGWGCSGGLINVVGPKDVKDLSAVVDWLQANTHADMDNIGISGISYGSGISLMGIANEPRIKTAVAMSTWGSTLDSLWPEQTTNLFWGGFLVSSGYITGTMDPIILENFVKLLSHEDVSSVQEWAEARSPRSVVDLINERQAPIYMANAFGDHLFNPNQVMKFYETLTGPKRLDLNQGTHASAEGFGLIGLDNYTWNNAHDWFDYWLKGIDTGIMDRKPVTMLRDFSKERDEYTDLPVPGADDETFYFSPRSWLGEGGLKTRPHSSWFSVNNTIHSGIDSGATTGIPLVSAFLEQLKVPVKASIPLIWNRYGMVYQSPRLHDTKKIRGIPKVSVNVSSSVDTLHLVAYLYDVNPLGIGTLITHGPMSRHDVKPGKRQEVSFELLAASYNVPEGHRIAIAFDTVDLLYSPPTLKKHKVNFHHSSKFQSTLTLPTVD